ncbi:MAG: sialate O-acetylesterase [Verrucomicrobia bacterium]|nr:MAG: sialate O-acetylesterase [Verrucomicrobiota bacterium]
MSRLHLFLLAGQSNMAGRGPLPEGPPPEPDPNITVLTEDMTWAIARDPLHFDRPPGCAVGPGLSFARRVREQRPDWSIGLVPTAMGGSPLEEWQPGEQLLVESLRRARHALDSGVFEAVLWHQGEKDSRTMECARTYGDRLAKTIGAFRDGIGSPDLPFIAGEIGGFLADCADPGFPCLDLVNAAIRELPERVSNTAWVSAEGLTHKGDLVHLDTPSQIRFGCRYAEAFLKLFDEA